MRRDLSQVSWLTLDTRVVYWLPFHSETDKVNFNWHDGGRSLAGFSGFTKDCAVRAIAIGTGKPYKEVYDLVFDEQDQTPRKGTWDDTLEHILTEQGWSYVRNYLERLCDAPIQDGAVIYNMLTHAVCVVDGEIYDTWNCSERDIYGFYLPPKGVGEPGLKVVPARTASGYSEAADKIHQRLKRLRATAENSAATEGEREAAQRIIHSLLEEHQIEEQPNASEAMGSFSVHVGKRVYAWQHWLGRHIADRFQLVNFSTGTDMVFTGPVDEAETGAKLFVELLLTIKTLAIRHYGGFSRGNGGRYAEGFVISLLQTERKSKPTEPGVGVGIIEREKDLKIHEWLWKECDIRLTTDRGSRGTTTGSESAFMYGCADGESQGVDSSSGKQLRLS
ncbi:MAG: DUF2786 domain-containing protein [Aureliella sp.]